MDILAFALQAAAEAEAAGRAHIAAIQQDSSALEPSAIERTPS